MYNRYQPNCPKLSFDVFKSESVVSKKPNRIRAVLTLRLSVACGSTHHRRYYMELVGLITGQQAPSLLAPRSVLCQAPPVTFLLYLDACVTLSLVCMKSRTTASQWYPNESLEVSHILFSMQDQRYRPAIADTTHTRWPMDTGLCSVSTLYNIALGLGSDTAPISVFFKYQ